MAYFINSIRFENAPFDGHSSLNKFPHLLRINFSFANLSDVNHAGNATPICRLTVQRQKKIELYGANVFES